MPYPLRNLLTQLDVTGTLNTSETITDTLGNSKPVTKTVYLKITVKASSKEKYFRQLASSADNRLPMECYILDWYEVVNSQRVKNSFDISQLNPVLSFGTGTLTIYSRDQIDVLPVQRIFGVKFLALLDGFVPQKLS